MNQNNRQWLFALIPALAGALANLTAIGEWASENFLLPLNLPPFLHAPVILAFFAILTALTYYVFRPRSKLVRPERFNIRASSREELFGRDAFLSDIGSKAKTTAVLFLTGESGSGKSAVLSPGLTHDLSKDSSVAPVLLELSSSDWDIDPLYKLFNAINENPKAATWERSTLAPPKLAGADPALDERLIVSHIRKLHDHHGIRFILMIDQMDDYVIHFIDDFVDARGSWISADDLEAKNRFWRSIAILAREGVIRLVIALRTDAASVIPSLSFNGLTKGVSIVQPLDIEDARELFERASASDSSGETVAIPDAGWRDLSEAVLEDIATDGAMPIQDVRMALLGMRELRALTPSEYTRVSGLRGLTALYVRRTIERVSARFETFSQDHVRALIHTLVGKKLQSGALAGSIQSEAALLSVLPSPQDGDRLLAELEKAELIRRIQTNDHANISWNLYHDSLARAVIDEKEGYSNWDTVLRDKFRGYRYASRLFSVLRVLPNLLGLIEWSAILKERIFGRLRLGDARTYFMISSVKPFIASALLVGAWLAYNRISEHQEAELAVASIVEEAAALERAQVSAWVRGGNYRASIADAVWKRIEDGRAVSSDQWDLLISVYSYSEDARADLLRRIDDLLGSDFDPQTGDEEARIAQLKAIGLAGEIDRLQGVIEALIPLAEEECRKDASAFSSYDTRLPNFLTQAAIASDNESTKRRIFELISPCSSSIYSGQNFFLQSLNESMNSSDWRKDHFMWAISTFSPQSDFAMRVPTFNLADLQRDIEEIDDPQWSAQAAATVKSACATKSTDVGISVSKSAE